MRLAALLPVVLLAGCTTAFTGAPLVVKNETPQEISGEARLLDPVSEELVQRWGFTVPGLAFREVARLPERDLLVEIRVEGGPTGQSAVDAGDEAGLLVRVQAEDLAIEAR